MVAAAAVEGDGVQEEEVEVGTRFVVDVGGCIAGAGGIQQQQEQQLLQQVAVVVLFVACNKALFVVYLGHVAAVAAVAAVVVGVD